MKPSISQVCIVLILSLLPCTLGSQTKARQRTLSPREFVEGFYAWYVPQALSDDTNAPWKSIFVHRSGDFSHEIVQLLREDSTAQAKCEELVGLDFDPFLYTQDPEEHYEVGQINQEGKAYFAEIYGVRDGKRLTKPALTVEFSKQSGHWQFLNFHYDYPGGADLISVLRSRPPCTVPRKSHVK